VHTRWAVYLATAVLAGTMGGILLKPVPVVAVAREIVELQQNVNRLLEDQQDIETTLIQHSAVSKILMEQSLDMVNSLTSTMTALQKTIQEIQANSAARLETTTSQVEGISDNLQETLARMGKFNQQLVDLQSALQGIGAKLADRVSSTEPAVPPGTQAHH
jgi:chromosome segregation ATPase